MPSFDTTVRSVATRHLRALEKQMGADVGFYYGQVSLPAVKAFRDFVERLHTKSSSQKRLALFLNTPGGSAEAAEKMVEIMRFHYAEVWFVVPDVAYSAGTILCMSGDKIFMDYSSSLGPIDPQVYNGKEWVPALGYLEKVEDLLARARSGKISEAEFLILKDQDLARLSSYEQARDLTKTLLKKWLVQYKFKDWQTHRTDPAKKGQAVTPAEREQRAEEVAATLGDHKLWHSHGRMIGPATLRAVCRLDIDDYSTDTKLRARIREYNDLLTDYIARMGFQLFMNHRNYF